MTNACDLRLGDYREVLRDVEPSCVIADPPYSARAHAGFRSHDDFLAARSRSSGDPKGFINMAAMEYDPIDAEWCAEFVRSWAPRTSNWFVLFGDHLTFRIWEAALEGAGWYVFAPVGWVRTGGTPRFQGDGPACSIEWICVRS